jgi:hypothetical protein
MRSDEESITYHQGQGLQRPHSRRRLDCRTRLESGRVSALAGESAQAVQAVLIVLVAQEWPQESQ